MTRKKGPPLGNQNARKYDFYSTPSAGDPQRLFARASKLGGIDAEVTLMRVQIKALLDQDPQNPEAITRAVACLGHLLRFQRTSGSDDHKGVRKAIAGLIEDLGIPPGLVGDSFKKPRPN